ncbi:MAG: TonB-dependent siderophore receptor [Henriciella sp.]|nr:TonB-dependent siderophore receptor [Henriciella sp.]
MSRFQSRLLGAAALSVLIAAPIAQAQASDEDEVSVQDEIVVVGQYLYTDQINALKAPTPIIDVPQSLSIITADQILQQGFDRISDLISYTPGVNASQGEGHRDAVVFRGVRSTADFFIDGVRDDVQYYRPLYNLEQVEILRGANALLFGRGGTGGLINRVTKKAELDDQFAGYQASVDTFGAFGAQVDSNFVVSDNAAIRVNAMYESLENHRDFYDGDRFGINPTAKIELSPATTVDLSYEYINHERFIDRGIPTGTNGRPVEAFEDIVFGDADLNTTELEAHLLRGVVQHQINDTLKARVTASYSDYDKLYQNFYASSFNQAADPTRVGIDGYVDTTQRRSFTLTGDLIGEFETGSIGHTFVAGAEYIDTSNDNDRFNAFWSGSSDDVEFFLVQRPLNFRGGVGVNFDGVATTNDFTADLNDRSAAEVEVFSIYVNDQIEVNEYLDIIVGLRFDSFDFAVDVVDPVLFDTGTVSIDTRSSTDDRVSPRAGLVFKPQENVSLYASYSESFLPRSGEQFATISGGDPFDPDVFETAEIGVKWDFVPGLSFTAAYFQNEQTRADRDDDTGENFEVRGLEIEGIELQLQGNVTEQLFVTAGYSYLDGETDNGAEIPRELPENTFSVWGAYQVTDKLGFGLGATYQDESFITDFDIGDTGPHPTLPAYTRVDAAAYYDISDTMRVQLNIENLTDELYYPTSHSTHQATVAPPLNAKITLSGKF